MKFTWDTGQDPIRACVSLSLSLCVCGGGVHFKNGSCPVSLVKSRVTRSPWKLMEIKILVHMEIWNIRTGLRILHVNVLLI